MKSIIVPGQLYPRILKACINDVKVALTSFSENLMYAAPYETVTSVSAAIFKVKFTIIEALSNYISPQLSRFSRASIEYAATTRLENIRKKPYLM
jgi:hypothetical protein